MLSSETLDNLKSNGYSFEEIKGIELGLKQSMQGDTISVQEMDNFVKNELFSKYLTNNV